MTRRLDRGGVGVAVALIIVIALQPSVSASAPADSANARTGSIAFAGSLVALAVVFAIVMWSIRRNRRF